jgi:hypothetical protein
MLFDRYASEGADIWPGDWTNRLRKQRRSRIAWQLQFKKSEFLTGRQAIWSKHLTRALTARILKARIPQFHNETLHGSGGIVQTWQDVMALTDQI